MIMATEDAGFAISGRSAVRPGSQPSQQDGEYKDEVERYTREYNHAEAAHDAIKWRLRAESLANAILGRSNEHPVDESDFDRALDERARLLEKIALNQEVVESLSSSLEYLSKLVTTMTRDHMEGRRALDALRELCVRMGIPLQMSDTAEKLRVLILKNVGSSIPEPAGPTDRS